MGSAVVLDDSGHDGAREPDATGREARPRRGPRRQVRRDPFQRADIRKELPHRLVLPAVQALALRPEAALEVVVDQKVRVHRLHAAEELAGGCLELLPQVRELAGKAVKVLLLLGRQRLQDNNAKSADRWG